MSKQAEAKRDLTMTWYAAHVVESITKSNKKDEYILVYENVVLVEAENDRKALTKAKKYAKAAIIHDETLTLDNEPAVVEFVGIRKVITISNPPSLKQDKNSPTTGTEISYSEFRIKNQRDLRKFAKGDPVTVEYLE
jgi:hypothetical protein